MDWVDKCWLFLVLISRFYGEGISAGEGCQTDSDGPQKQVQCVFPFELKGKTYYECTWREEENNKPWCSTKVDSGGLHVGNQGNWGYCAPECPMEAKDYKGLGCWKDTGDRAIETLEGKCDLLDGSYSRRTNPIEKCYKCALSFGYEVFALQDGGWCAGSATAMETYRKYGEASNCPANGEGGDLANNVYIRIYLGRDCCFRLWVNSIGLAQKAKPETLGLYVYNQHVEGKPVYKLSGKDLYLYRGESDFLINNVLDDSGDISSDDCNAAACPERCVKWQTYDEYDDPWTTDKTLSVSCEGNVLLSGVGGHAFSYEGCFNHSAGGNTPVNFPGWAEYGVDSVEECLEHCLNQSKSYFGITDSDCPSAGKQADCHCGERLPTEQYQDDACRDCIDNDGKEYHCGKCGWNLDVYRIHQTKEPGNKQTVSPKTFAADTVYIIVIVSSVIVFILVIIAVGVLCTKRCKKYMDNQDRDLSDQLEMDQNVDQPSTLEIQNTDSILGPEVNQKPYAGMSDVDKKNWRTIALERQLSGEPTRLNPSMDLKDQTKVIPYNTKREIKRSEFTVEEIIGSGNFGAVFKGKVTGVYGPNKKITVAIKTMNDTTNENQLVAFLDEIKIMSNINHHLNLVNMVGSCTSEYAEHADLWVLLEFCQHGDLKKYLVQNRKALTSSSENDSISSRLLIQWCYDIAQGMKYLARIQIMHGDLAARNVLLGEDPLQSGHLVAKVSDFGLSKVFDGNSKYEKKQRNYVPWKWMALEYLTDNYFTMTSDVWSFGVVVWEILSAGKSPYGHKSCEEMVAKLESGYRLPCPTETKHISSWAVEQFYNKLSEICFVEEPKTRATFTDVVKVIEDALNEEEIKQRTQMCEQHKTIISKRYNYLENIKSETV